MGSRWWRELRRGTGANDFKTSAEPAGGGASSASARRPHSFRSLECSHDPESSLVQRSNVSIKLPERFHPRNGRVTPRPTPLTRARSVKCSDAPGPSVWKRPRATSTTRQMERGWPRFPARPSLQARSRLLSESRRQDQDLDRKLLEPRKATRERTSHSRPVVTRSHAQLSTRPGD